MKDNLMDIQNLNIRAKTESLIPDLKISVQLHWKMLVLDSKD